MPTPTVHIVDDEESLRRGLARLLKSHGHATELFASADDFIAAGLQDRAGCLVLDVHMPGLNGLELQEAMARARCHLPIIFLTGRGDIPTSVRAMKAGAADFLTKPVDEEILLAAIERALAEDERRRAEQVRVDAVRARLSTLTAREFEVMRHVIAGALNKQIGDALAIAEKTVKIHRGRVMEKTGVDSVAELVRLCELAGVPPADRPKVI